MFSTEDGDGLTLGSVPHRVPFQCNTSVRISEPVEKMPTAKQLRKLPHAIPVRPVPIELLGFGLDWIDHTLPFQCSTSVRCTLPAV